MNRIYVLLGALAVIGTITGAAYLKGRSDGRWAERIVQLEAINDLNEQLAAKDQELADLEAARLEQMRLLEERVEELTEEARADANADRPALGVGSVHRLNSITGD